MANYLLTFFLLLVVAIAFFLVYKQFLKKPKQPVSQLYVEALIDLLNNDQIKAFTKLRQVVSEDSHNIDAYLRLGKILCDNKKPDRALQVHKDLTLRTNLSNEEKSGVLHHLAEDYIALNDFDTAEAALKELTRLKSQDRWAYEELLKIQEKANKWEDAYETATQILKIESNKSKKSLAVYKYRMGDEFYKKKDYHKARVLYKEALGLDPHYIPAFLSVGDSYCEEKRFEDAINFWNKLISTVPDQGHRVINRLKKTLFDLGRYGELSQICQSILEHDPENLDARLTLAEFSEKKGDLETAREILEKIIDDHPDNLSSIIELIRIYLEKDDLKKLNTLVRNLTRRHDKAEPTNDKNRSDSSLLSAS